jgi:hypothetical protein
MIISLVGIFYVKKIPGAEREISLVSYKNLSFFGNQNAIK